MRSPIIGTRQLVYENEFHQEYRVPVDFGGFTKEYFVREDGIHVGLVVVKEQSILLVRQYRLLIDGLSWEIPGGGVDEGESLEEAAIRECLEETGLLCSNLRPLIDYQLGLDTIHNPTSIFVSDKFEDTLSTFKNVEEVVDSEWIELSQCVDMIFRQQISSSFSVIALLAYQATQEKK
jgi:ADP-ribose pyrophosphatase